MKEKNLIMGFSGLKSYQITFFANIIGEREKGNFKDLGDLFNRTFDFWEKINQKTLENWANIGLFRDLEPDTECVLEKHKELLMFTNLKKLFPNAETTDLPTPFFSPKKSISKNNVMFFNQLEEDEYGFFLSFFSRCEQVLLKKKEITSLRSLILNLSNRKLENLDDVCFSVYALINSIKISGINQYLLQLLDIRSSYEVFLDSNLYHTNKEKIIKYNEMIFRLCLEVKGEKIKIFLKEIIEKT